MPVGPGEHASRLVLGASSATREAERVPVAYSGQTSLHHEIVRRLILDRLGEEDQKRLAQLWEKAMPGAGPQPDRDYWAVFVLAVIVLV